MKRAGAPEENVLDATQTDALAAQAPLDPASSQTPHVPEETLLSPSPEATQEVEGERTPSPEEPLGEGAAEEAGAPAVEHPRRSKPRRISNRFFSFCVVNAKRAASTKEATYALFVVLKYQPKISCLLRSVMYGG